MIEACARPLPMCMEEAVNPLIAATNASALVWGLTVMLLFPLFRLYGVLAGAVLGIVLAAEAARCICECRLIYAASVAAFANMLFSAIFFAFVLRSAMWHDVLRMGLMGLAAFLINFYFHCRRQAKGGN